MNLRRCNNGHFYDADKFKTCPHCNATMSATEATVALEMEVDTDNQVGDSGRTVSLQDAVNAAMYKEDEYNSGQEEGKTVSFYSDTFGTEPVVGWLVCIEGDYYGKSFPLKSGRNFVGRNVDMDISLSGDMSISRERHAIIIYEPKRKCFIAQPGDSHELFYLNDEVVLSNVALKSYDILSIGNEKLLFSALCGPEFCWEDTKKEEK